MELIEFLLQEKGLLFIQALELAFFITLAYILTVEWRRTLRNELRSKVIAVSLPCSLFTSSVSTGSFSASRRP